MRQRDCKASYRAIINYLCPIIMKIKILLLILTIVVSIILNYSCTSKSAQEKLEDAYSKEYCQQIMNEVLSKYMIVDWDSIARQVYIPEDNSGSMLIVDGYGKCSSYGNERFHVSSVWRINKDAKDCDFSSMQIRHKELGDIISINGPEDYTNSIMDSTEFAQKFAANKVTKSEIANERTNMVALAYQNRKLGKNRITVSVIDHVIHLWIDHNRGISQQLEHVVPLVTG